MHYKLSLWEVSVSGLYLLRWTGYAGLFFVTYEFLRTVRDFRFVLWCLVGGAVAFSAFGIYQAAFLPDFALMLRPEARPYLDFDPQGHRLVSTFFDPNIAAGYILFCALVCISFFLEGRRLYLSVSIVLVISLLLTLSRGGILGFACGFVFLLIGLEPRVKFVRVSATVLLLLAISFALYPFLKVQIDEAARFQLDDPSAMARIADWIEALQISYENPIWGIGFNTFGFVSERYGLIRDGSLAFGLAGDLIVVVLLTGLVGFSIYLTILWRLITGLSLLKKSRSPWCRALGRGVQAGTIGIIVSSFFTTLLLYPQIMALLWVSWALGVKLSKMLEKGWQGQILASKTAPTPRHV